MNDIIEAKNQELVQNVVCQINSINDFIKWSQSHLDESRKVETFKKLVDKRRLLKRILFSLSSNPAIAAFGESQKGKSYVISSLLASKGKQFMVEDKDGKVYNFIEEMNPHTNNTEATGVVTRFTTHYEVLDQDFPIKVRLLSVADILQILCDTAYQDVKSHAIIEKEDINEFMESIARRYKGMPDVQDYLDEDDIFNIREYVGKYMSNVALELLNSSFFDTLAQFVRKLQPKEWPSIMSKMWYDNPDITALFRRVLDGFQTIDFTSVLYIPISSLLNTHTTLMSSACLQKLVEQTPTVGNVDLDAGTDVLIPNTGGNRKIAGFSKSILSAMTAEIIFKIPDNTISEQMRFRLEGIKEERIKSYLLSRGWNQTITKEFLKAVDILDFPGARSRLELDESQVAKELSMQMVLRGKVSYLFNKYSDEKLINVLMLCHDYEQNGQAAMPPILQKWVANNIGSDAKNRTEFIDKSVISPLFIIATKFNVDLRVDVSNTGNEQIDNRWNDRFIKVLYNQVLMATSNDWFDKWTEMGSFKNTYLLRDYKYSGDRGNRLFNGFTEYGEEQEENDREFHQRLKTSFLNNVNVRKFFDDPELAWDSACSMNNDGAVLIIQNLAIAAGNAKESRYFKTVKDIRFIHQYVQTLMAEYYHDENAENILQKAIARSGAIVAEFDVVCGKDNYFFGRMIQNLQISENYVFDFFYSELNNTRMITQRDMKEYDLILSRCHGRLSADKSYEENLEILRQEYHFPSIIECKEFFEDVKSISLERLFECNFRQKTNSEQLAEGIIDKWLCDIKSQKNLKFYEAEGCNTLVILDLIDNLKAVATALRLDAVIARSISPFVDAISVPHSILDMIADFTAEVINEFVVTFGYGYYSEQKITELKQLNEKNQLHLSFDYGWADKVPMSKDELSDLFDDIRPTEESALLTSLPSFINYNKWIDMMLISFIASCDVPTYDVEANKQLGRLLEVYDGLK